MTASPTLTLLRAAVVADPADDTVRLAYADALDEEGGKGNHAHAKLIRLMIAREREYGPDWFTIHVPAKVAIERSWLLKTFKRNWRTLMAFPVPRLEPTYWEKTARTVPYEMSHSCTTQAAAVSLWNNAASFLEVAHRGSTCYCHHYFSRGFISRVKCHYPHWERYGAAITACEPIESVELTTWPQINREGAPPRQVMVDYHTRELHRAYPHVVNWTFPV